ncbi:MAG: S-layer homology domain-containing protein [Candidatus Schekmanbacteria bacterium]|nr:S-layer homology domain-containing protein [Candidatus Schekmanbacteria bacterium]
MPKSVYKIFLAAVLIILSACTGPKVRPPESVLDTPEHHYQNGMKYYEKGEFDTATREFQMAKDLQPKYAPAYAGLALIDAQKRNFESAFANLEKADDYARNDGEKTLVLIGNMRVLTARRGKNWLEDVEADFQQGVKLSPQNAALFYYMGQAHKTAYQFERAGDDFKKVLELSTDYILDANREWNLVQIIQRAAPGTIVGKEIALIDKIDRADTAALFIQELKLDKLLVEKAPKFDTGFKPPGANDFSAQTMVKAAAATDIENHVLKADIDEVIKLNLRGLAPYPDHTFHPDEEINRAAYAVMLEDIIIAITKDEALAAKFIGQTSPFPDIRSDHWAFNAIMTVSSRGIMAAKDIATGEFRPQDSVSGAEALLIIRQLKEKLKL